MFWVSVQTGVPFRYETTKTTFPFEIDIEKLYVTPGVSG